MGWTQNTSCVLSAGIATAVPSCFSCNNGLSCYNTQGAGERYEGRGCQKEKCMLNRRSCEGVGNTSFVLSAGIATTVPSCFSCNNGLSCYNTQGAGERYEGRGCRKDKCMLNTRSWEGGGR